MANLTSSISAIVRASACASGDEIYDHLSLNSTESGLVYNNQERNSVLWETPLRFFLNLTSSIFVSHASLREQLRLKVREVSREALNIITSDSPISCRENADTYRWFGRWLAMQLDAGQMTMNIVGKLASQSPSLQKLSSQAIVFRISDLAQQYLSLIAKDYCSLEEVISLSWKRLVKIAKGEPIADRDVALVREFFRSLHTVKGDIHTTDLICALWKPLHSSCHQQMMGYYYNLGQWIAQFEEHRWILDCIKTNELAMQWCCILSVPQSCPQSLIQHPKGPWALIKTLYPTEKRAIPAPSVLSLGPFLNWVGLKQVDKTYVNWKKDWVESEPSKDDCYLAFTSAFGLRLNQGQVPNWNQLDRVFSGFCSGKLVAFDVIDWIPLKIFDFEDFLWSFSKESLPHYECLIQGIGLETCQQYQTQIARLEQMMASQGVILEEWVSSEGIHASTRMEDLQDEVRNYLMLAVENHHLTIKDAIKYGMQAIRSSSASKHPLRATAEEWLDYALKTHMQANATEVPAAGFSLDGSVGEEVAAACALPCNLQVALQDPETFKLLFEHFEKIKKIRVR